jgi:hypothetical protein
MELELYSLAETPQLPHPSYHIWAHIRGRYWSAKIEDISLQPPAPEVSRTRSRSAVSVTCHVRLTSREYDLYRTMLCCGRMIRLLAHPLPSLSWQQVVSVSQSPCVSPVELTDGRGGEGVCGGSQIIRPRESLALYKSLYTLHTGYGNTCL